MLPGRRRAEDPAGPRCPDHAPRFWFATPAGDTPTLRQGHPAPPHLACSVTLSFVIISLCVSIMVGTTAGLAIVVAVLRRRRHENVRWAGKIAHRLTSLGHPFKATDQGHAKGSIAGRNAVLARAPGPRTVAVVTLHLPLEDTTGPERPNLKLPEGGASHRFGPRWVQAWVDDGEVAAAPGLLTHTLSLAQAAERQQTAPWELFAGQQGLDFHESSRTVPCAMRGEVSGVPVQVHLEGVRSPPLRTIITAAFPRARHRAPGPVPMLPDVASLLTEDAEVGEDTVKLAFPGMVVDELEQRIADAVSLARALAGSARG